MLRSSIIEKETNALVVWETEAVIDLPDLGIE
jgi:hypothetical protein